MAKPESICIVTTFLPPHLGGVERYVQQFSIQLTRQGVKVVVVALNTENLSDITIENGVQIYRLPSFGLLGGRFPIPKLNRKFLKMFKEISLLNFDLFIINMRFYLNSLTGIWLAKKQKKPVILLEHVSGHMSLGIKPVDFLGNIYEHVITWYLKKYVTQFFGVSQRCCEWLKHFGIEPAGVIYNGIDSKYQPKEYEDIRSKFKLHPESVLITYAGRLLKEKGLIELVSVFKKLSAKYGNIYLFIAGSGNIEYELKRIVQDSHDKIFILGEIENGAVMNLLKNTDIAVNPSNYPEGLPTIILEAGLKGCSLITTNKGGAAEVITDEKYGILINSGDETAFYNALEKMVVNRDYRISSAENLHRLVIEKFSWTGITDDFIRKTEKWIKN